ncbi:DJ-1/PfpI family protein, partial [Arthrobacter sp. SIMBA_036]|uniref:DJ-1/PfpI family protein n=1 Tax=Arthrobacter sp. SIMBA_036 TaxID=3085778 RepID=UPI00397A6E45
AAGAAVSVIGIETGKGQTNNSDLDPGLSYQVDNAVRDVSADDFDGLVIPGGCVGADKLRANNGIIAFVRSFFEQRKPVGVICH